MKAIKFICIIIVVCMLFGCAKINRISHFGTDIPEYTAESIILTTDNYSNTINSISQDAETDTFVETDFESNEVITSENTTKPKETKPATSKVTDSSDSTPIETNPIVTTPTETEPIIEETTAIEETEPTIVETEIIETTVFDIINTETIETAIDDTSINTNEDVIYITMIRSMGYYSGQHIVLGGVEIIINDGRKWRDYEIIS